LDTCAANLNWDVCKTAEQAVQALTGKSLVWYNNMIKECPEVGKDWQLLKSKLLLRFGPVRSLTQCVQALQGLTQGPTAIKTSHSS